MSSFARRTLVALTTGAVLMPLALIGGPVAATAATVPVIGASATLPAHPASYVRPLRVLGSGSQGFLYATTTGAGLSFPTISYRKFGNPGAPVSLGAVLPESYSTGSAGQPSLVGDIAYLPVFDQYESLTAISKVDTAKVPPVAVETITMPGGFTYVGPVAAPGTGIYVSTVDDQGLAKVYPWTKANGVAYASAVAAGTYPLPDPVGIVPPTPVKFTAGTGITEVHAYGGKLLISYRTDDAHTTNGNYAHLDLVAANGTVIPKVNTLSAERIIHANLGPSGVVVGVVGAKDEGVPDLVNVFWADTDRTPQVFNLGRDLADVRLALTSNRLVWADGESTALMSQTVAAPIVASNLGLKSTGPLVEAVTGTGTVLTYTTPNTRDLSISAVNPAAASPNITTSQSIPFQPADTFGLDVSARRVVSQEESVAPAAYATRDFTVTGGNAAAGADTAPYEPASYNYACNRLCFPVLTSGNRTVRLVNGADGTKLLATNGAKTTLTRGANTNDVPLSLSGPDLVYWDRTNDGYVLTLLNVDTGVARTLTDSSATVRGRVLYEVPSPIVTAGLIKKTDLATGAVTDLMIDPTCQVEVKSAVGSWLLYTCNGTMPRVYSLDTGASVNLPTGADYRLGDGFVGLRYYTFVDPIATSTFKVLDLTTPAHTIYPVGSAASELARGGFASAWSVDNAGGQALVYESSVHDLVVVPVNVQASPVKQFTSTLPAYLTPDGDGQDDVWAPQVEVSKPATWLLTVRDSAGGTLYTQSSPAGPLSSFSWDGTTAGVLVADGTYGWTITATPADGIGVPVSLSGSVVLRVRAVAVAARASTFSSDVTTNGLSTISWSSAALPPYATGYTISRRQVLIASNGGRTYGAEMVWLRDTRLTTAKLYVPPGVVYQILVTVSDSAPIRAVKPIAYVTTASPFDDRALKFSRGWYNKKSSSAYKGTMKYSSKKGTTATRTVYGSSLRLLGTKCKKCGSVTVTVDGRKYGVSTYARSTRVRQILFSTTRSAGRHVIKVTVSGTKGRPGVWLDGLGVTA